MGGGLSSARLGNSISIDSSDSIILESQSVNKSGTVAIVYDIIIDDSHPLATNSSLIGAIKFRKKNNIITDVSQLPIAYPFDKNFKNIPIINESVEIHESSPGLYFYKRITQEFNPTISAVKNAISNNFPEKKENTNQSKEYQQRLDTNIPKTNKSNSSLYNLFGKYYESLWD